MNFTIPKTTPPGKYLMRAEHLYIQTYHGGTQLYVNCAHLEITGPGGGKHLLLNAYCVFYWWIPEGKPGPTTKFPAFTADDSPGKSHVSGRPAIQV